MSDARSPTPAWAASLVESLLDGARPGDLLPWGARLDAVRADDDAVRVATSRDGASAVAWLKPRSAGGRAYRTTAHFLVGHDGSALDAGGVRLLDELHAAIARREAGVPADLLAALREHAGTSGSDLPLPIEWLAVRAGVKPAARQVPELDRWGGLQALVASAARHGLHALAVDAADYLAHFTTGGAAGCKTIVYVGATREAARATRDAERAIIDVAAREEIVPPELIAALGRALGYPDCCIEFFARRADCSNAELRFEALARTGPLAFALLNDVRPPRSLVSHFVCRYDCAASRRYARAVFDAVGAFDGATARELAFSLEGVVLLFRAGGALQLTGARAAGADGYAYRSVSVHGDVEARWRDILGDADEVRIGRGVLYPSRERTPLATLTFDPEAVEVRPFVDAA